MKITPKMFEISKDHPYANVSFLVFGERMCCSHPGMKPDNCTYPFLTTTAAKGIADAFSFDKIGVKGVRFPAFRNIITKITAIRHPDPTCRETQGEMRTMKLNAVKNKISYKKGIKPYNFERWQRFVTFMENPCFKVDVRICLLPIFDLREDQPHKNIKSYKAIFERKVRKNHSYKGEISLGLAMFTAKLKPYDNEPILPLNIDIGPMIYDDVYNEIANIKIATRYFWARVVSGVMDCNWLDGHVKLQSNVEERIAL